MRIALLMTEENIVGREMFEQFGKADIKVGAVIVEHSKHADDEKEYLKNDFYGPPTMVDLLQLYPTEIIDVTKLNGDESFEALQRLAPEVVILDGSTIIKERIFTVATFGSINSHPGLLPEYRGLDSVRWSIFHGKSVGATCHFVDKGLDTGPILVRREVAYQIGETILQIRVRVMRVCAEIVVEAVRGLIDGSVKPVPQPNEGGYYSWAPQDIRDAVDHILATGIRAS